MIRVGTRASALALAQARWVVDHLGADAELVPVTTAGDRGAPALDKSRWVAELERALLAAEIDVAVHSAKDVPTELPEGLELVAFPLRGDPFDAVCGAASLAALASGSRVGTSSLRRRAQIAAVRADLSVTAVHGNVDTRLGKLYRGEVDALVLAAAGLQRLGRTDAAGGRLTELVPACGQGALALEARPGALSAGMLAGLDDPATRACVSAERELVRALGASCHTPVGAYAHPRGGVEVELTGWVGLPDGSQWVSDRVCGPSRAVGSQVAERMVAVGAGELLARAAALETSEASEAPEAKQAGIR